MTKIISNTQDNNLAISLTQIELRIVNIIGENSSELASIAKYLLSLGGKRIRPSIAILTSQMFGMDNASSELIDAAAGIELIHMASLLHDDIIDNSQMRRLQESALKRFGEKASLLAGDYLFAKAFGLCAKLDRFIIDEAEKTCVELAIGEMLEQQISYEKIPSIDNYFDVVSKKTASLFSLSAIVGAHLAGASHDEVEQLRKFGDLLGKTFQMADDILDVLDDGKDLGKASGSDILNRTPSLPNILWLNGNDPKALLYFKETSPSHEQFENALHALRSSQCMLEAGNILEETADHAISTLGMFGGEKYRSHAVDKLKGLVDRCLTKGALLCKR